MGSGEDALGLRPPGSDRSFLFGGLAEDEAK